MAEAATAVHAVRRSTRWRWLRRLLLALFGIYAGVLMGLYVLQDRMLFLPRSYPVAESPPQDWQAVPYDTAAGAQVAWWWPPVAAPTATGAAYRVWIVLNGNASVAWDWEDLLTRTRNPADGFLLVDWPGFGRSQGTPSRQSIQDSIDGALAALARQHGVTPTRLGVLGHSMGCAPALEFSARQRTEAVILAAPYTSLLDMACRRIGWPHCLVLKHRWDNRSALAATLARPDAPRVLIAHGTADPTIPISMSEELAAAHPGRVTFLRMQGAGHNFIFAFEPEKLAAAFRR
jgi:pimeloyl-ACP methyl ester carboxylesterase